MMATTGPYRFQVLLDADVRRVLRTAAFQEETSMQKLVTAWLIEKLRDYPGGQHLQTEDDAPTPRARAGVAPVA